MAKGKFPYFAQLLKLFLEIMTIWILVSTLGELGSQTVELQTRIVISGIATILLFCIFLYLKQVLSIKKEMEELLEKDKK